MRACTTLLLLLTGLTACSQNVQRLGLRDNRLPSEARRWLADAEDELVIARARVDDARTRLAELRHYLGDHLTTIIDAWSTAKDDSRTEGEKTKEAFATYAKERLLFSEQELGLAEGNAALAKARLALARAETAIRYDLSVYDTAPIIREVERLKQECSAKARAMEEQRARAEMAFDQVWLAFAQFSQKGGATGTLWLTP